MVLYGAVFVRIIIDDASIVLHSLQFAEYALFHIWLEREVKPRVDITFESGHLLIICRAFVIYLDIQTS